VEIRRQAIADGGLTAYSFNCIQFDPFSGHRRLEYPMGRDDHTTAPADCLTLVMPLHCAAVHAVRVNRCITTKYQGAITLAGVRGVAVADVIRRLGASSQLDDAVSALFLPEPAHVLV
jgi:hypothetical protein